MKIKTATISVNKKKTKTDKGYCYVYTKAKTKYTLADVKYFDVITFIKTIHIHEPEMLELREIWKDKEINFVCMTK